MIVASLASHSFHAHARLYDRPYDPGRILSVGQASGFGRGRTSPTAGDDCPALSRFDDRQPGMPAIVSPWNVSATGGMTRSGPASPNLAGEFRDGTQVPQDG